MRCKVCDGTQSKHCKRCTTRQRIGYGQQNCVIYFCAVPKLDTAPFPGAAYELPAACSGCLCTGIAASGAGMIDTQRGRTNRKRSGVLRTAK